jgi:hypothetical protein
MPAFPSFFGASGLWTLKKQLRAVQGLNWPLNQLDAFFRNVTLLLRGDGATNGAQNNTFLDSSSNAFTVTRNGNATQGTFAPYGSNWSNYFDGSTGFFTLPINSATQFGTGDFTIEAWINRSGAITGNSTNANVIGTNWSGSSQTGQWIFYLSSTDYKIRLALWSSNVVESTSVINVGQWYHVAVARSGTTTRLFVNGVLEASATDSGNYGSTTWAPRIGNYNDPFGYNGYFNGYISNLRVVKGSAVYTAAFTPSTVPLTAITNTSLLTCQSNRFIDNSSNAFTITRNGDVSVQRFSPFNPTNGYAPTTDGGSGYFDGTGDYLNTASGMAAGTSDFTVEAWVYPTGFNTWQTVFGTRATANSPTNEWSLGVNTTGYPYLFSNAMQVQGSAGQVARNTWTHLCVSRSGSTMRLFVNGQVVATGTNSQNFSGVAGAVCANRDGTEPWTGYVADLRYVVGTAIYTSAFTPPTAPLTAIANTRLLLNFTNAGIFDSAEMNNLETVGPVQISTGVSKYGSPAGSMQFAGSTTNPGYLPLPYSDKLDFGTANFTIEMWLNPSTTNHQSACLFAQEHIAASNTPISIALFLNNGSFEAVGNRIGYGVYGGSTNGGSWVFVNHGLTLIQTNLWTHVALQRNGNVFTLYVNGVSVHSTTNATSCSLGSTQYFIGRRWDTYGSYPYYNGFIDDFRITRGGPARYTGNFTPPVYPLPNQ